MGIRGSWDTPVRVEALGNADHGFRFHRNAKLLRPGDINRQSASIQPGPTMT